MSSRVLEDAVNQITCTYKTHCDNKKNGNAWAQGIDLVKYKSQLDFVTAHSDGTVVKVIAYLSGTNGVPDKEGMGYGNYVMIKHNDKICTLYAHLEKVYVNEGEFVKKGQRIGFMGNTGGSYGAHLHFEVREYPNGIPTNGLHDESKYKWLDPTPYIDADITGINTAEYKLNGLDYSPVFNPKYYLNKYADLKAAFGSDYNKAWAHFKQYGMKEARQASAEFNVIAYKENYADLRDAFGDNLPLYYEHYCNYGRKEGRNARTVEKKTLTLTSYPNYTSGNGFYRVRKSYRDEKNAIGSYCTWSSAYKTWKRYKSSGYHIYDKNGKQLD